MNSNKIKLSNNAEKITVLANSLSQKIINYSKHPNSLNAKTNKPNFINTKNNNQRMKSPNNLITKDKNPKQIPKALENKIKKLISDTERKKENLFMNKLISSTTNKKSKENLQLKRNDAKIINSPSAASNFAETRKNLFSSSNSLRLLSPSPSLRPFPVVNNEFYDEVKNNVLWEGHTKKLQAEKSLHRNNTERRYLSNNFFIFNKSETFKSEKNDKNDTSMNSEMFKSLVSKKDSFAINPINKENDSRRRDYHSTNVVIDLTKDLKSPKNFTNSSINTAKPSFDRNNSSKNFLALASPKGKGAQSVNEVVNSLSPKPNIKGVFIDQEDFRPVKKITPMHLKLYESTQQENNYINKMEIPRSHKSYVKRDDVYSPSNRVPLQKKVEFLKGSQNLII